MWDGYKQSETSECASICLSACLLVCLSAQLLICLFVCLPACLLVSVSASTAWPRVTVGLDAQVASEKRRRWVRGPRQGTARRPRPHSAHRALATARGVARLAQGRLRRHASGPGRLSNGWLSSVCPCTGSAGLDAPPLLKNFPFNIASSRQARWRRWAGSGEAARPTSGSKPGRCAGRAFEASPANHKAEHIGRHRGGPHARIP